LAAMSLGTIAQAQFAHLVLDSDTGDYIGGGHHSDVWYTPADTTWFFGNGGSPISGAPSSVSFTFLKSNIADDKYATLDFNSTHLGLPLALTTYTDAERAAFASDGHPGMDVTFEHRGSNTLTGTFTIRTLDYTVDPANSNHFFINDFVVDFEQHSEGAAPALHGTFSFHAVPEPATIVALLVGAAGVLSRRKRKHQ
jgi:hypothetical protein